MLSTLTCGWAIACHNDSDNGATPPKAPTVPNVSADPLPIPTASKHDSSPTPNIEPTLLSVGVDIDSTVSADEWLVKAEVVGAANTERSFTFMNRQAELTIEAPENLSAMVRVEVYGTTKLSSNQDYIVGHRVVTTQFVPHAHRLLYVFVEGQCAYSSGGSLDGGSGCGDAGDWCYDGKCRAEALPTSALAPYRSDWREHPPSPCASDVPQIALGEGLSIFTEKRDGDTVTMECGSQGGHHLWIAARTKGFDQRSSRITITSPKSDAGAPLVTSWPIQRLYASDSDGGAGTCETTGVQFQLDPDGRPIKPYLGQPIDVTIEMQDDNGQKANVTRHLQIAPTWSTTSCFGPPP